MGRLLHTIMKRILPLIMLVLCPLAYASEPVSVAEAAEETSAFFCTPVGDAVVPMIILLLCYCLFRLVRGEAREDQELA